MNSKECGKWKKHVRGIWYGKKGEAKEHLIIHLKLLCNSSFHYVFTNSPSPFSQLVPICAVHWQYCLVVNNGLEVDKAAKHAYKTAPRCGEELARDPAPNYNPIMPAS